MATIETPAEALWRAQAEFQRAKKALNRALIDAYNSLPPELQTQGVFV